MYRFTLPPLRGSGSQSYSQNNGSVVGHTSKTYSSSPVGTIQGDATMKWESYGAWGVGDESHSFDQLRDMFGPKYPIQDFTFHSKQGYIVSSPPFYDDQGPDGFYPLKDIMAGAVEGPYKYRLEYTMSTDEDGNTTISDINLIEEDLMFSFPTQRVFHMPSDSSRIFPTANEFRPVNIAVKYFIRAR